jgi:hypothetical protein
MGKWYSAMGIFHQPKLARNPRAQLKSCDIEQFKAIRSIKSAW